MIGQERAVRTENIIGVFDLDGTTVSRATRDCLRFAEKSGICETVSRDLPRSFLVTEQSGERRIFLSPLAAGTILKRVKAESKPLTEVF